MAPRLERSGENEGQLVRPDAGLEENHGFEISPTEYA